MPNLNPQTLNFIFACTNYLNNPNAILEEFELDTLNLIFTHKNNFTAAAQQIHKENIIIQICDLDMIGGYKDAETFESVDEFSSWLMAQSTFYEN